MKRRPHPRHLPLSLQDRRRLRGRLQTHPTVPSPLPNVATTNATDVTDATKAMDATDVAPPDDDKQHAKAASDGPTNLDTHPLIAALQHMALTHALPPFLSPLTATAPAAAPLPLPLRGPRVLFVCAEVFPLLKTGGLADVCAALPDALRQEGADVRLLIPAFPSIAAGVVSEGEALPLPIGQATWPQLGPQTAKPPDWLRGQLPSTDRNEVATSVQGTPVWLQRGRLRHNDQAVYVLHAPALFDREGHPYVNPQGHTWADAPLQFAWLGWAAACLGLGHDPDWSPQVLHGHDWHSGLAPAYLHVLSKQWPQRPRPTTVFTIHNLAYQGQFDAHWRGLLGIPDELFHWNGLEFHGQLCFIKGGLCYSDHLTTVSPRYAQEITQSEQGCGLDGVLRHRQHRLSGILNGVDERVWHPAHDPHVQPGYDHDRLLGKSLAKARLQTELGLEVRASALLCVVVSRLTEQKGLHLLPEVVHDVVQRGGQLAVLGSGDAAIESALAASVRQHPEQVALRLGYDEALAHRLIAGGDVILVPSRFEPCGLTQLYGLRYGTLPVVRAVGGLADTVTDCTLEHLIDGTATGFVFHQLHAHDLWAALRRALALWQRPHDWHAVQQHAMRQRHDWHTAAQAYLRLYHQPLS